MPKLTAGATADAWPPAETRGLQLVERLAAHLIRPPQLRMVHDQLAEGGRAERDRLAGPGGERDLLRDLDRRAAARRADGRRDGAGLPDRGVVGDVRVHRERGAAQVRRVVLGDVGVGDAERAGDAELDRELDAGVVVRRDLVPVHVIEGEHRVRVVRVQLQRERVSAAAAAGS